MLRREFLAGGAALAAVPSTATAGLFDAIAPWRRPTSVGRTEIEQILLATRLFQESDHEHGGGYARAAAVAHLRTAADMLDARCPEPLRPQLLSAVAHLADNCGFMTFDDGHHVPARRMWDASLACTEEAQDWHLQAAVLVNISRQAVWLGQPDEALSQTERALAHSHQITATERAVVWSTRAGAHAQRGDVRGTLTAIRAADDHFADADPDDDPPWMYYYDAAEHQSSTGHALYDLVMATGGAEATEAATRQREAVGSFGNDEARSRALSGARLAIILMRTGDPDEAAQVGMSVIDAVGSLHSQRTRTYMDVLSRAAEPHADRTTVDELRSQISASL